ncbi:Fc.00g011340.m01.CDS01 [Cosmosporella sp. VM-42]
MLLAHFYSVVVLLASLPTVAATRRTSIPQRPQLKPSLYDAGAQMPFSTPRDKHRYCHVLPSHGYNTDDASKILHALKQCIHGGTVVLDESYRIASPLDLTFLKHRDVVITGEIHFSDDGVYYWAENSFKYEFQNQSVFWKLGGEDVNIYGDLANGKSVIDGLAKLIGRKFKPTRA